MTVEELIKKLSTYDNSLRVTVQGYEGGYDDVIDIKEMNLILDWNKEEYLGRHEEAVENNTGQGVLLLVSNRRS